jgi:hypothetical protein
MHGTPFICLGLTVMRVNFMSFTLGQEPKKAFYTPPHRVRTAPERRLWVMGVLKDEV